MRYRKTLITAIVTMGIFLLFNIALSGNITVIQLPEASKPTVESAEKDTSTSEASKQKTEESSALKVPLIFSRALPFLLTQP